MSTPFEQESSALDDASIKAIDLVRDFSEYDPKDLSNEENPWRNPDEMFAELDAARTQVMNAADMLKNAVAAASEAKNATKPDYDEDFLRAQFMDMITDAFADVLTGMKQQGGGDEKHQHIDVDVLADCLQSGMDLWSQEDREFFLQDIEDSNDGEDENEGEGKLTPHEARRRELGFVSTTA
mmetsp:Transcript_15277/g.33453  ORF Transcript_15277/g.33453 Transcript_15277/m.33453 type:complete len:182 (+) Transcript_15277:102-647(+)|eukprot:CAMPEP_0168723690 /NCGR_PEP_ID=MMETSP0724-20121128/3246_1 /TAXON_ID=265536 /ORGANISM="Amphiprora sp., Strain CCMP467" /LENGTH=181 /DNA_ID=CAMNT_0008770407 /DNA_START=43 /DNA_END=588 /DNA_ORIENTATION=+